MAALKVSGSLELDKGLHGRMGLHFKKYHQRSNVETTFSLLKRRFQEHLRSKTFPAQVNELYARAIAHNIVCVIRTIHELGLVDRFVKAIDGDGPGLPNVLEPAA